VTARLALLLVVAVVVLANVVRGCAADQRVRPDSLGPAHPAAAGPGAPGDGQRVVARR
jgi:hypothetical protein